jgi:hypothetical protein
VRKLAEATGYGKSTVQQILTAGAIKPHKIRYWCGKSPDPEFAEKQTAIIGLYLSSPENALLLCVDEKSQIQALDRTQPVLPMRPDDPARLTATYKRNGTSCLLAALAVHEGAITGKRVDSANSLEFLRFLKRLYRQYPSRQLHVIVDNLSTHKQEDARKWVAKRRRLTLHFTPTYASWLNQIARYGLIFSHVTYCAEESGRASGPWWSRLCATSKTITNFGPSHFSGHIPASPWLLKYL